MYLTNRYKHSCIRSYIYKIKAANDNIGTIILPVANARIARNMALYNPEDGFT